MRRPNSVRRFLKWGSISLAAVVALAAIPVVWIETQCVMPRQVVVAPPSLLLAADRREEVNTYLTYPEWSIVHAYQDLAAVQRRTSESDFDYFGSIRRYWSSLCAISKLASSRGTISGDYKVMLHTIGLSFAAEMGIKGLYEKSIGRITAVLSGGIKTPEDKFALALAEDYAQFLRQVPWYEYPFGVKLIQFWRETPLAGGNFIRKVERRISLSIEWGAKSLYARLIAIGAASSPAPLRIKSVVNGLSQIDVSVDQRIKVLEARANGIIIETDRYATFTDIVKGLAARGGKLTEVAGNQNIMVTVFSKSAAPPLGQDLGLLFAVPVETQPGWYRLALNVKVANLLDLLRNLERAGAEQTGLKLDHIYDY